MALGVLDERGDGVQERVGDPLKLTQAPPCRAVAGLLLKAAFAPEVIRGRAQPRLDVDVPGRQERHHGELPVAGEAVTAPVLVQVAGFAQVIPHPALGLQQPHHVQAAADRLVTRDAVAP